MNGVTQIKLKQKMWATRNKISLNTEFPYYVTDIGNNIFRALDRTTEDEFINADGGELKDIVSRPAKMKAIHSSSALAVNIFQYWRGNDKSINNIAEACGFCSKKNTGKFQLEFERKFTIKAKKTHYPNMDVVISKVDEPGDKIFAIESKMCEPFGKSHSVISGEYLNTVCLWDDLPALKSLASDSRKYKYLDVAQLIKHILGLMNAYENKDKFLLMYLYYDVAGKDGAAHYKEMEDFKNIAISDGIEFRYMSYQELLAKLCEDYYVGNETYCDYISDRYL